MPKLNENSVNTNDLAKKKDADNKAALLKEQNHLNQQNMLAAANKSQAQKDAALTAAANEEKENKAQDQRKKARHEAQVGRELGQGGRPLNNINDVIAQSASFSPDVNFASAGLDAVLVFSGVESLRQGCEMIAKGRVNNVHPDHFPGLFVSGAAQPFITMMTSKHKQQQEAENDPATLGAQSAASQRPAPSPTPKPTGA